MANITHNTFTPFLSSFTDLQSSYHTHTATSFSSDSTSSASCLLFRSSSSSSLLPSSTSKIQSKSKYYKRLVLTGSHRKNKYLHPSVITHHLLQKPRPIPDRLYLPIPSTHQICLYSGLRGPSYPIHVYCLSRQVFGRFQHPVSSRRM